MDDAAKELLIDLLQTPSPSGYEQAIQAKVRNFASDVADEIFTDNHGNVIARKNPGGTPRLMFAGHCDQIGLIVSQIDEMGFIYTQPIGGWDPQQLVGQRMMIWTQEGGVPAVIARKPIHLLEAQEREQVVKLQDLWLDIGAKSRDEAAAVVRIGDCATLQLGYQELRNRLANAPGMDNTVGLWAVLEGLRRAAGERLHCELNVVSTVQEEIGLRGAKTSAYAIDPQVAIAVDVTHATDCPTIDQRQQGEVRMGAGPVVFRGPNMNPRVVERLIGVCGERSIPYQLSAIGRGTPNDANSLQITRGGVATGLVSIPNRYMHSAVETISLDDIHHTADLLAGFALSLRADDDFTP